MRSSFAIIFIAVVALSVGCSKQATTPNTNGNSNGNANATLAVANPGADTATAATTNSKDLSTIGSLATPTDAYRTAYELREKKDVEGLKKVFSKDVIAFLTEMGESEEKTLDDMIKEIFFVPQYRKAETRNEKISGEAASIEYMNEKGKWMRMDFVREDGVWKMAPPNASDLETLTSEPSEKPAKK